MMLTDGFHRIAECRARGYSGRVWAMVRDHNIEDDDY